MCLQIRQILFKFKPLAIFNLAAETHVDRSIDSPKNFIKSNIVDVFNFVEEFKNFHKKYKKTKLIHISTDEVYGDVLTGRSKENNSYKPSSPYAATKAAAELLINSYITTFNSDVIITRCTNNFGPRQFPEKLIPKTIILANNNMKIPIYGTGKNIRDWMFVEDHCNAVNVALLRGNSGESYNISADNEIDNITIVKKILAIMNKSEDLIEFVEWI